MSKQSVVEEVLSRSDGCSVFEAKLLNLLALMLVQKLPQPDQYKLLSRAGFRPSEIAPLLGTTPNAVSVVLYQEKMQKKKGTKTKPRK